MLCRICHYKRGLTFFVSCAEDNAQVATAVSIATIVRSKFCFMSIVLSFLFPTAKLQKTCQSDTPPLHHKLSHLLQSAYSKLPLYLHTTYPLSQSQFSQIMSGRRISMSFAKRLHSRMGIDANLILDYARNAPRQSMAWSRGFPCLLVSDRWSQGECWCTRQPALA